MTGMSTRPRLSVNVNKIATIRNSRGGDEPSVLEAVEACIAAGAPGITVHPRADARHITAQDVRAVSAALASRAAPSSSTSRVTLATTSSRWCTTSSRTNARSSR